jgi:hypothetical protein
VSFLCHKTAEEHTMIAISSKDARKLIKPSYHNHRAHIAELDSKGILRAPGLFGPSRFEAPKQTKQEG